MAAAAVRLFAVPVLMALVVLCQHDPQFLIHNGDIVLPGSYPWVMYIRNINSEQHCGGSLIAFQRPDLPFLDKSDMILTAAHCLIEILCTDPNDPTTCSVSHNKTVDSIYLEVWYGTTKLFTTGTKVEVAESRMHPTWKFLEKGSFGYDVGLIRLKEPLNFGQYGADGIQLAPKSLDPIPDTNNCWLAGWGAINGTYHPPEMRHAQAVLYSTECKRGWGDAWDDVRMLCAGKYPDSSALACGGDSGGPLFCAMPGATWLQVGITSFTGDATAQTLCGNLTFPTGFMKISAHIDWIEETANQMTHVRD